MPRADPSDEIEHMPEPTRHVVYVSHGSIQYAMEAAYSILSVLRHPRFACHIHVLTDHADELKILLGNPPGVNYLPLTPEKKCAFIGSTGYVHRLKPQAIGATIRQVANPSDTVLFLDTDTIVVDDPEALMSLIESGTVVLNECEGPANRIVGATPSQKRIAKFFRRGTLEVHGRARPLDPQTPIWNSGVIGLQARRVHLFDETLDWIDAMWPDLRVHTVEQIAFSAVLHANALSVCGSGEYVFHYWWFKEFRADLQAFFSHLGSSATLEERLALWHAIRPDARSEPKRDFMKKPKWQRSILKRIGRNWRPLPIPWSAR
jgi:hypothetical protein